MAIFDRGSSSKSTRGSDADEEQTYRVVAQQQDGKRAALPEELDDKKEWRFEADNLPSKEQFRFEYGDILDPGITYVLGPEEGTFIDFDNIVWSLDTEPEIGPDDELRAEIRALREEIHDGGGSMEFEDRLLEKALQGDLSNIDDRAIKNAERLGEAAAKIRGTETTGGIFDQITDKTDAREVFSAIGLSVVEEPDKIRDITSNVVRGLRDGVVGEDGPPPAPGHGAREEPDPEPEPEAAPTAPPERGRTPTARERFEELESSDASEADGAAITVEGDGDQDDAGDDPEPPAMPANATELDELTYQEKAALAAELEYPGNPYSTQEADLREWLVTTLFVEDTTASTAESESTAESDEKGPVTHSEVQAGPEVADAIEADSEASDDAVADGGEE